MTADLSRRRSRVRASSFGFSYFPLRLAPNTSRRVAASQVVGENSLGQTPIQCKFGPALSLTRELLTYSPNGWVFGWVDSASPIWRSAKGLRSLARKLFSASDVGLTAWSTHRRSRSVLGTHSNQDKERCETCKKLKPTSIPILVPKLTAPSPALVVLGGCQIREMNALRAALPKRE